MSRLEVDELWGLASLAITQFHPYKGIMTINMALVKNNAAIIFE